MAKLVLSALSSKSGGLSGRDSLSFAEIGQVKRLIYVF